MGNQIVSFLLFLLTLGTSGKDVRIIGGQSSESRHFPYLVSFRLVHLNKHICAGTIIAKKHILTAGHCAYKSNPYNPLVKAYTGIKNSTDLSGSAYLIKEIFLHVDFHSRQEGINDFHNDIAVVKVHGTIEFNEFQNMISLSTQPISDGDNVILCGWGLTSFPSNQYPNQVQSITVPVISKLRCSRSFTFPIRDDQICTHKEGEGACIGDSGGPVVRNGEVVGIISFSVPCATDVPDVHTDIYKHVTFIRSILHRHGRN